MLMWIVSAVLWLKGVMKFLVIYVQKKKKNITEKLECDFVSVYSTSKFITKILWSGLVHTSRYRWKYWRAIKKGLHM